MKVYRGATNSAVVEVASLNTNLNAFSYTGDLAWGNNPGGWNRTLNAALDDLRIYGETSGSGGALSQSQLDAIRVNSIPEPGSLSLLTGAAALAALFRRMRRRAV